MPWGRCSPREALLATRRTVGTSQPLRKAVHAACLRVALPAGQTATQSLPPDQARYGFTHPRQGPVSIHAPKSLFPHKRASRPPQQANCHPHCLPHHHSFYFSAPSSAPPSVPSSLAHAQQLSTPVSAKPPAPVLRGFPSCPMTLPFLLPLLPSSPSSTQKKRRTFLVLLIWNPAATYPPGPCPAKYFRH